MPKELPKAPPRNELSSIVGINERVMRYLESLSGAIQDSVTLTGEGPPTVPANQSRLYIDLTNNRIYFNSAPEYGSTSGWVAL